MTRSMNGRVTFGPAEWIAIAALTLTVGGGIIALYTAITRLEARQEAILYRLERLERNIDGKP